MFRICPCDYVQHAGRVCGVLFEEVPSRPAPVARGVCICCGGRTRTSLSVGDTLFPWGNDSVRDRPPKSHFCDWEVNEGQLTKERRVVYPTKGCTLGFPTDDVSPLGVANLGSNVLEWTSGTYREDNGIVRCTVMGLDFSRLTPTGFPAETDLVARVSARCDPALSRDQRASDLIGFRCATSAKSEEPDEISSSAP